MSQSTATAEITISLRRKKSINTDQFRRMLSQYDVPADQIHEACRSRPIELVVRYEGAQNTALMLFRRRFRALADWHIVA